MGDLQDIFLTFCDSVKKGSNTATDKTISKICSDCHIYSKQLTSISVDIAFKKHVGNNKKFVDYDGFVKFVDGDLADAYAKAHGVSQSEAAQQIRSKIISAAPKSHGATKTSGDAATSRLTDVKGYTGAHKERFDVETGKGKGISGREYLMDEKAASGYVGGYKGKDTYDKKH